MDDIKDIQTTNFSKLLDVEIRTNPFGENRSGERAYRRAERIAAALLLLTNHIAEADALRAAVRRGAVELLQHTLALRDEMRAHGESATQFQVMIRSLISQVHMLVFAGFVSPQNAQTVSTALDELGNFLSLSQRSTLSESVHISKESLVDVREYRKGQVKDIRDTRSIKDKQEIKDTSATIHEGERQSESTLTSRSAQLLEVLRHGGEMNIRDIAAHVPEYGEKTIQRELAGLISGGLVRRNGLKRWSRYSIV